MCKCEDCKKEMETARSCVFPYLIHKGKAYDRRITQEHIDDWGYTTKDRCGDCGIQMKAGNVHHYGCDIERCPICGGQLISCDCFDGEEKITLGR